MRLSPYEMEFLEGKHGEAGRLAMTILVKLGELYGAEELIPIAQAHIDGGLYAAVGEAGLAFAERLAALGGKVVVPTTMNATSRDIHNWQDHLVRPEYAEKSARMEKAYLKMGVLPTWTCAPYQGGVVPRFGEQIAWAESNAIAFVNSVIGARTERYGDYTDICCALTGRVPYFGLHKKENRRGEFLLDCSELRLDSGEDLAVLGYLTGKLTGSKIPVLQGIPEWVGTDDLKAFSAAVASSGSVAMFHMLGITPEAADERAAFQGQAPERVIKISQDMLEEARKQLSRIKIVHDPRISMAEGGVPGEAMDIVAENDGGTALNLESVLPVDAVLIGCPHASVKEMMLIEQKLHGKKVMPGVELWIYTQERVYAWLRQNGVLTGIEQAGAKIIRDTCFVNTDLSGWHFRRVMTNSAKYAHYIPSRTGLDVIFASLPECLAAALG